MSHTCTVDGLLYELRLKVGCATCCFWSATDRCRHPRRGGAFTEPPCWLQATQQLGLSAGGSYIYVRCEEDEDL